MRLSRLLLVALSLMPAAAAAAPPMNRAAKLFTHPAAQTPLSVGQGSVTAFDPDEGTVVTFAGNSAPTVLKVPGKFTWNPRLTPQGVRAAQMDFARCRVVLWNLTTRKAGATLQGDFRETFSCDQGGGEFVFSSDFTADGRFFLAADHRGVRRWDARTGALLNTRAGDWDGFTLTLSPDGRLVSLTGPGRRLELWTSDLKTRFKTTSAQPSTCLNRMGAAPVWSPDSRRLAFSCEREVRVWNVQAGGMVALPRTQTVEMPDQPTFSPDSRFVVAGEAQHGLEAWQVGNGQLVTRVGNFPVGVQVTDVAVTKGNLALAALSDGRLLRLDLTRRDLNLPPVQVFDTSQKAGILLWPRLTVNPEDTWFAMTDGRSKVNVVPLPLPDAWK